MQENLIKIQYVDIKIKNDILKNTIHYTIKFWDMIQ